MSKDDRELIERINRMLMASPIDDDTTMILVEPDDLCDIRTHLEALQAQPVGETIASIAAWCDETFGPAGAYRIAQRAKEELKELLDETPGDEWTDKARIEAADVLIILLRTPRIWEAIEDKMAINREREWRLTGDGCGYHIPTSPAALTASPPVVEREAIARDISRVAGCQVGSERTRKIVDYILALAPVERVGEDVPAGVMDALSKVMPIRVQDGPDYADVFFSDGIAHSTQAMTMNPQDWRDLDAAYMATLTKGARDAG